MCDKTDTKNKKTDKVYTMDTKHTLTNISRLGTGMNLPEPSTRNPDRIFFGYGWGGYDRCLGRRFEGDGNECDVSWITFQWWWMWRLVDNQSEPRVSYELVGTLNVWVSINNRSTNLVVSSLQPSVLKSPGVSTRTRPLRWYCNKWKW